MAAKGRLWVALWLLFVLAVLAWVVARQTAAHVRAARLAELRTERSVREARKAELLQRIRDGESRAVLVPRAEALGLRMPADSEIVILEAPRPEEH
jgi:hypothetical protein